MSIQRYLPTTIGTAFTGMKPAVEGGNYVLYTDHAAEVERLTAERDAAVKRLNYHESQHKSVTKSLHAIMDQRQQLATERDAAVARAERAEAVIYDEAMDHRSHGFCDCPLCKFADALAAAPNHIGDVTKVVGFDAEEHDQMLRDLYADTPDKPQYAALAPEPWGGPEE